MLSPGDQLALAGLVRWLRRLTIAHAILVGAALVGLVLNGVR